jgi:tetratricopeptide (TPR) repeat protein
MNCNTCKKNLFFNTKYYSYPGNKKDKFKVTSEKIECGECFSKNHRIKEIGSKDSINLTKMMLAEEYKEALKLLNSLFDKNDSTNWYNKGNILLNLNKPKEALKCYECALMIDTHYIKAWYRRGYILSQKKNFKGAINCFENVVELEGRMTGKYPNENWYLAGVLNLMLSITAQINTINENKKSTKKIKEKTRKEFTPLLLRSLKVLCEPFILGLIVGRNKIGLPLVFKPIHPKEVNLKQIDNLNGAEIGKFIKLCSQRWEEILDVIEPKNIAVEVIEPGDKH